MSSTASHDVNKRAWKRLNARAGGAPGFACHDAPMARRRLVWLLSLPLATAGWLSAHSLAYALVAPHDQHGGVAVPILVACAITVLLAVAIHDGFRRAAPARVPAWPVGLLPPLGFAVQEHLERFIELNQLPIGTVVEPVFLAGLTLQLPVALVVLGVATVVLAAGHALGRELAVPWAPRPLSCAAAPPLAERLAPALTRPQGLATGYGGRAPPSLPVT